MLVTHKTHEQLNNLKHVFMLSAWGFTMVVISFLFLYVGHKLDGLLGTAPNFMLGLFVLGLFLCIMRLYQEANAKKNEV
jgi:F0F1-type ATP synthase assembly protein I